jgi:LuxR family maltose regulon positive regulatory protein
LIERLNAGLQRKLILISAPAGFGKTTLLSEWIAGCGRPVAWLSLDKEDDDLARFLSYLVGALQMVPSLGGDYHLIQAQPIHDALSFLLDHMPPSMHLVLATRADPPLPIARLRGRGQLTELCQTDLRFTIKGSPVKSTTLILSTTLSGTVLYTRIPLQDYPFVCRQTGTHLLYCNQ